MKLFLLLFAVSLQVSASVHSQQITLNVKNAPLVEVMQSIRKQSGLAFMAAAEAIDKAKPVTVSLKDATIEESLRAIFKDQPFDYKVENKFIILTAKVPVATGLIMPQTEGEVRGVVVDSAGRPVANATVLVKGEKNKITSTNSKGEFYITDVPEKGYLVVRSIGFGTIEVPYKEKEQLDIRLAAIDSKLNEVQIIAYGTTIKRFNTGNISGVKASDIEKSPVTNALLAIQGRVPGINIQQTSGIAAAGINITIQGNNSLRADGNNPFYVIDGVPYPSNDLNTNLVGGGTRTGLISAFSFLNPSDIESIEILKDADATAIYGSRAANGAILITTKKGKAGKTKVNFNLESGLGKIAKHIKLLNTADYLALRKEAKDSYNQTISPTDYDLNGIWDPNRNVDWQKELVSGTSQYNKADASISGGTSNTQFLAGGGYIRETTVYPTDFSDKKVNVHLNINHKSDNNKFHFTLTGTYVQDINNLSTFDLMIYALRLSPNAPPLKNNDGSINWDPIPNTDNYSFTNNPLSATLNKYHSETNNIIGNAEIGYKIFPELELKTTLGYNRIQTDENAINPQAAYPPSEMSNRRGNDLANKSIKSWILEPQLTYNKEHSFGHIEALLGSSFQATDNYFLRLSSSGYTDDSQLENIRTAPNVSIYGLLDSKYRYNAVFGRFNYRFKDRYIFTAAARRDGTSRFGSENLFANFYSLAGAWIFTEEMFLQKMSSTLSFGKLRISYGITGSDQIPDYQFLSLYDPYSVDIPYQNVVGAIPTGHSNPYLQWEKTRKFNFGIDLGFLNNRILFNANYFINRSSNQLLNYPLPTITGFGGVQRNIPALVQNKGLELFLEGTLIKGKFITWSSSINFSVLRNKLLAFDGLSTSTYAQDYVIGKPTNIRKAYPFLGVNSQTGLYDYRNAKGETTSHPDYSADRTTLIDINPKFFGGWTNTINYKGIQLDFLIQFVKQTGVSNEYNFFSQPGSQNNIPDIYKDHWKNPGDNAKYAKVGPASGLNFDYFLNYLALTSSEVGYANASFFRLKNASLSYSLPGKWISKAGFSSARVYMLGQNLLTWTHYFGLDPETQTFGAIPPLRVYTLGVQFSL